MYCTIQLLRYPHGTRTADPQGWRILIKSDPPFGKVPKTRVASRKMSSPASSLYIIIPVIPHKAVAEVSRIGHYWRGELLWCMDGRANPLMDGKVVGVVLLGVVAMVAVVTSLTTPGCNICRSCSCSCICSCSCSVVVVVVVSVVVAVVKL